MSSRTLLPTRRPAVAVDPLLLEMTEQRMLVPARRVGQELAVAGTTALPQSQEVVDTQWGKWLFVDHVEDPTATQYGGDIPVPEKDHAKLVMLDRAGVRPDLVWLGHQLPASWKVGDPVPVPAPRPLREKDAQLAQRLAVTTSWFLKAAGALLAAAAAPAALGAVAFAGVGLDPIVLGGVKHPDHPVVQWCVLAQWEWQ